MAHIHPHVDFPDVSLQLVCSTQDAHFAFDCVSSLIHFGPAPLAISPHHCCVGEAGHLSNGLSSILHLAEAASWHLLTLLLFTPHLLSSVVRAGDAVLPFWVPPGFPCLVLLLYLCAGSALRPPHLHLLPSKSQPVPCFNHHPGADDWNEHLQPDSCIQPPPWHPHMASQPEHAQDGTLGVSLGLFLPSFLHLRNQCLLSSSH